MSIEWSQLKVEDLWCYDKLILSKKLGYVCGPSGVEVPTPGEYIVRPVTNIVGMSRLTSIHYLTGNTDHLQPGMFWSEIFTGQHLSIDYHNKKQVLCVEGNRDQTNPIWRWDSWERVTDQIPYPEVLEDLVGDYPEVCCEFIGGKLIEVQLRSNMDLGEYDIVVPQWVGTPLDLRPEGYTFYPDRDYLRVGFWKKKFDT